MNAFSPETAPPPAPTYAWSHLWTVPGLLSLSRLPLALAFVLLRHSLVAEVAILAAAGLSDVLDGYAARKLGQQSATGAALDGIVDKVFVLCVVLALALTERLHGWQLALLGVRDAGEALLLLGLYVARRRWLASERPHANAFSKLTTVLQYAAVLCALGGWPRVTSGMVAATALAGTVTVVLFAREFRAHHRDD